MTPEERQTRECERLNREGHSPQAMREKGYAEAAIQEALKRARKMVYAERGIDLPTE